MDDRWLWFGVLVALVVGLVGSLLYFGNTEPKDRESFRPEDEPPRDHYPGDGHGH